MALVNSTLARHRLWPVAVFLCSLSLYVINSGGAPHPDELYHVLAARGLLLTGSPVIAEGVYDRVYLYTWLVARFFQAFGESLPVARLPSALAMAGTVTVLFVWLRHTAGLRAALLGAGLFAVSPFAVDTAQLVRFYGLQTLTFLVGSLLIYGAVEHGPRRRWAKVALGTVSLVAAIYLQSTSLLGVAGLLLWLTLRLGGAWVVSEPRKLRKRTVSAALLLAGLTAIAILLLASGSLQPIWDLYRSTSLFNRENADNFLFYPLWYTLYYPTLWPSIALLVVAAVAWRPKPAFFAAAVFVVSLVLNSFAASKNLRYIIYAQPYAFMVFGFAIASVWAPLGRFMVDLRSRFAATLPFPERASRRLAQSAVVVGLGVLLLGNTAFFRTVSLLADIELPPEEKSVRWDLAKPVLDPILEEEDVVVTMAELEMLYNFDRYDILLSASRLGEIPDGVDFSPDFRTGRPVIGSVEAMRRVLDCYPSGVFVTNTRRWRNSSLVSAELVGLIERSTVPVALPKASRVLAFRWSHENDPAVATSCEGLPAGF